MTDFDILQGADPTVAKALTPDEKALKMKQNYYAQLAAAQNQVSPIQAQKLAFANQRLASVQAQQQSFNEVHPEYQAQRDAQALAAMQKPGMSLKKKALIGVGVLTAGVLVFLGYRKFSAKGLGKSAAPVKALEGGLTK